MLLGPYCLPGMVLSAGDRKTKKIRAEVKVFEKEQRERELGQARGRGSVW